ncbi:hypothetical protein JANAI62_33140 [Jannaschia pagri]|uniref:Uncharacterized protein n=1 Tax=Jannaschia pagri TaxID=2829797 RepID=A0ABQ4NQS0_9RHOB|nr:MULTISPECIES: hypothetical protein [unclassified Jannaschia]GIT92856.1 hypothetical protein JANAI61_33140 [Jannaschia sp. AI_61]GIT96691.1 hypothetical protein JANAI62_33140 [Jannaschia sp. AI_62]
MGRNDLYLFGYLDPDGKTPLSGGPFSFLNVCEMKTAVDVAKSWERLWESGHIQRPSVVAMQATTDALHHTIKVLPAALTGPDIWMDTQMTRRSSFLISLNRHCARRNW